MKQIFNYARNLILILTVFIAASCSDKYDDSFLSGRVDNLEQRVTTLEELCKQMNTNISSLQTLVNALQENDFITGVKPLYEGDTHVGYTIDFAKSESITIYHGKDGADGNHGTNGKDGADGYSPSIGIAQDSDGHYYWTLDGEWLLDDSGNKVSAEGVAGQDGANGSDGKDGVDGKDGQNGADGKDGVDGTDGITPQFKIEEGDWFISLDNGLSWQYLGRATGADGKDGKDGQDGQPGLDGADGDSMFTDIDTSNGDYVIFTLSNGTQIKLPTWYAFEELKKLCNQMNTNIQSLQTIVEAMEQNDYIVSCTPLIEDGKQTGYTITFAKSGSIVIYHGKDGSDGKDGADGKDGQDGVNGQDGHTPQIGVKEEDGVLYWTVDGEFLTDDKGQKIPVTGKDGANGSNGSDGQNGTDGKDGITPQFKIEDGKWWVSYDNEVSWKELGKATGDNGKDGVAGSDGESIFESVRQDDYYVYVKLADGGDEIAIPKNKPFSISFDSEEFTVQPGQTYQLYYTITGGDDKTKINVYEKNGLKAKITKSSDTDGYIEVTTPTSMTPASVHELIVMVNDGYDRTLMETLTFVKGVGYITNYTTVANSDQTEATVTLSTNLDEYTVQIPEEEKDWLSVTPISRATMRQDEIKFTFQTNNSNTSRSAVVKILDKGGFEVEDIYVYQHGVIAKTINVKNGHLSTAISATDKSKIVYLFLSGELNTSDYTFISQMPNLRYLDLSEISNTSLPAGSASTNSTAASAGVGGKFETLIFPLSIKAIPDYCFLNCENLKGDLIIPDYIETIGSYAFYKCENLRGDLVLGKNVTSIGTNCFVTAGNSLFCKSLDFKNVYCKNNTPPSITKSTGSQIYYFDSSFGNYAVAGYLPLSVKVPIGCTDTYKASKWDIFPVIEEVDFDKLGL